MFNFIPATIRAWWSQNINNSVVYSTAAGVGLFGLVVWGLNKTGIKALRRGASIAKGGE